LGVTSRAEQIRISVAKSGSRALQTWWPHPRSDVNARGDLVSEPRKHHYIPVCYLKQWANTQDCRLCEHKLVPGHGVKWRRTSPAGTGYQIDLYRVNGVPDDVAQDFEKQFMHLVDTDAAHALNQIVAEQTDNWLEPLRSGWTRFIISLLFRNPEAVAVIKGHIVEMWDEGVKALEADYSARRRPGDPETFEEFHAKANPHAAQIGAANFLAEVIDNDRVGPTIFGMNWSSIDLSKSSIQLLTSDRPLDMPIGLADPKAYIALPVSPRVLFIAAHNRAIAETIRLKNQTSVVRDHNLGVITRARRFVWGTTNSQLTFVRKHFGTAPDREILTEQQRREAIEAAQGKRKDNGNSVVDT
jgi:hypothetical protein